MHGCYLSKLYFSTQLHIYFLLPLGYFLLSEVVYWCPERFLSLIFFFEGEDRLCQQKRTIHPGADVANGVEVDSCINHGARGANRWRYKKK